MLKKALPRSPSVEHKEAHDFNGAQSGDDGQKNTAQEARPMEAKSDFPAAEDKSVQMHLRLKRKQIYLMQRRRVLIFSLH